MSTIKINDDVLKRLKHYARKDEDWSQTLTRLLNDAELKPQREYIPYNPPTFPDPYRIIYSGTGTSSSSWTQ